MPSPLSQSSLPALPLEINRVLVLLDRCCELIAYDPVPIFVEVRYVEEWACSATAQSCECGI